MDQTNSGITVPTLTTDLTKLCPFGPYQLKGVCGNVSTLELDSLRLIHLGEVSDLGLMWLLAMLDSLDL